MRLGTNVDKSIGMQLARSLPLLALLVAGCASEPPFLSTGDIEDELIAERYPVVQDLLFDDTLDFVEVEVIGGTSYELAAEIGCESLIPLLREHGMHNPRFSVYDPDDALLASSSDCR